VVDTTPPEVTAEGAGVLWPPNHMMRSVSLESCGVSINDQCQGMIDLGDASPTITCITSDELDDNGGDGMTTGDMVIVDGSTALLRAERADSQNGRVYHIEFEVSDDAGNVGTGSCEVSVPGDMSAAGAAVDDGAKSSVGSCD
jgi:hypothetical protein